MLAVGRAHEVLHTFSEEQAAAALVLTARRDPLTDLMAGSTAEQVLRRAARPLFIVRSRPAS